MTISKKKDLICEWGQTGSHQKDGDIAKVDNLRKGAFWHDIVPTEFVNLHTTQLFL